MLRFFQIALITLTFTVQARTATDYSACKWVISVEAGVNANEIENYVSQFAKVSSVLPIGRHTLIFATFQRQIFSSEAEARSAARNAVRNIKSIHGVDVECAPDRRPKSL